MRWNAVLSTAVATAGAVSLVLAAAPAASAAGWRNVNGGAALKYSGSLDRVDFAAKDVGWAVGSKGTVTKPNPVIARYTAKGWAAQASPVKFTPMDVAAASAKNAWVVGYGAYMNPMAIHWNGSKWAQVNYPLVGVPFQVSAAADGTAYSTAGITYAAGISTVLRWSGSAWVDAKVPLPKSTTITTVDVRSRTDVWIAGTTTADGRKITGLAYHYDGKTWKRINVPGEFGLNAYQAIIYRIVALSPTSVYAIKDAQAAQTPNALLHWDGKAWKSFNTPLNSAGLGLAADGRGGVVVLPAENNGKARYLHFNGKTWSTLYGPARKGSVLGADADQRPGTQGVVSVGMASSGSARTPFIELFG
ncbi:hypothetical protein AB0J52_15810 [Spirillospora sp. NPDC049652]